MKMKRVPAQERRDSFELVRQVSRIADHLAGAAANRRVVERDVAAATAVAAGGQAIAARLENRAAGLVARRAGDAAAILRVLTLADAASEVTLTAADPILAAADTAEPVAEHAAEILQRATGDFVFTATVDLEAARALLEFHFATRQDTPIGRGRRACRDGAWLPARSAARERSDGGRTTFHYHTRCHRKTPFVGPNTRQNERRTQATISLRGDSGEERPSFARPLAGQSASHAEETKASRKTGKALITTVLCRPQKRVNMIFFTISHHGQLPIHLQLAPSGRMLNLARCAKACDCPDRSVSRPWFARKAAELPRRNAV